VLQVGSNDLTDEECSVDDFVHSVEMYIDHLRKKSDVHRVVIMEVLHRKVPRQYHMNITLDDYNNKVQEANEALKRMETSLPNVCFWKHERKLYSNKLISP